MYFASILHLIGISQGRGLGGKAFQNERRCELRDRLETTEPNGGTGTLVWLEHRGVRPGGAGCAFKLTQGVVAKSYLLTGC